MKRMILSALAVGMLTCGAYGQDWPQWRGVNRDGKVSGFVSPEKWPEKLTKKWEAPIGQGDSCSALVAGKIYCLGRAGADEVVTCLNLSDGSQVWQVKYPADFTPTGPQVGHPGPRSSPLVADGKVYTLGVGGILSCLNAADGKTIWRKASAEDYQGVAYKFDTGTSPMLYEGKLIVGIGNNVGKAKGAIFAFDAATGDFKWKTGDESPFYSSPMPLTVDGEKLIVMFTENTMNLMTLSDGAIVWKKTFNKFTHITPIIEGNVVYYAGPDFPLAALKAVKKEGKFEMEEVWTSQLKTRFSTPVLLDGKIYGFYGNGNIACVNAADGKTLWTDPTARGQYASVLNAGSVVFVLTVKGDLLALKPGDKYEELAKYKVTENEAWAHPLIVGKNILIRDKDKEVCLSLE